MVIKGLVAVVGVLATALFYFYLTNTQLKGDLQVAIVKQEAAETSLRTAEEERQLIDTQFEQFTAKSVQIEKERNEARADVDKVRVIFEDHDFANLLTKNPEGVTRLMIKKTREVFDEIEELTAD
jgi:predicted Holliday junction resolvase-like endonuclease